LHGGDDDIDDDGIRNHQDGDMDGDGIPNDEETGSDVWTCNELTDTDGDGIPDTCFLSR
jgi:hypothetical protein